MRLLLSDTKDSFEIGRARAEVKLMEWVEHLAERQIAVEEERLQAEQALAVAESYSSRLARARASRFPVDLRIAGT